MARPFCCWTVIAALVQLYYEITASHELHICHVFSNPSETHQIQPSENIKLIKFDGIWFPYRVNNSTVNSLSTPALANVDVGDTTGENSRTSQEVTQIVYTTTSIKQTTTVSSTQDISTARPTRNINSRSRTRTARQTRNTNSRDKLESRPEWSPRCRCQIESGDSFMIKIVKVWLDSYIQNLNLQLNSSSTQAKSVTVQESWNQTFQDTSVTISIADDTSQAFYTVIVAVSGNVTGVTCEESKGVLSREDERQPDGSNKQRVIKANAELLFEAPLLLIGAVLAVIGSLLLISGIAVWRRYRKEHRRRRAKCAKTKRKRDEHQRNSYEMCTYERKASVRTSSASDNENSQRKFSVTSVSRSGKRASQAASLQPVTKSPTSSQSNHETKACFGAEKKQHGAKKKNKRANDKDNEDYSEIEQDYEDISERLSPSLKVRDTRVATPLAFVRPGELKHTLRKTDNLDHAIAKTRSLPPTELKNRDNVYSHLDRQGNLRSHCLRNENRDSLDLNNIPVCQTIDVRNSTDVFNVDKHSSDKPKEIAQIITDDEGMVTSDREEEQDHIYEAYEEQDAVKVQDNMKRRSNGRFTSESKPATDILQSTEGTGIYPCNDKIKTTEVIPSDLTKKKRRIDDNMDSIGEGTQNTETETILQKYKDRDKESSQVKENPRGDRPESKVRNSAAYVQRDPKEHQADIKVTRNSENGNEEFNNYDTNDQLHTATATKDPHAATLISNYTNITPAERSVKADRQLRVEDPAIQNEIRRNEETSNKDSDDCCDTYKTDHLKEASECLTDTQPQAHCKNTPSTTGYVNVDSSFRVSDVVNQNEIQVARISVKDIDISVSDLTKPDVTLSDSNLAETNTATLVDVDREGNTDTYRIEDDTATVPNEVPDTAVNNDCNNDNLESYTVVDNIVYGAWPLTEL